MRTLILVLLCSIMTSYAMAQVEERAISQPISRRDKEAIEQSLQDLFNYYMRCMRIVTDCNRKNIDFKSLVAGGFLPNTTIEVNSKSDPVPRAYPIEQYFRNFHNKCNTEYSKIDVDYLPQEILWDRIASFNGGWTVERRILQKVKCYGIGKEKGLIYSDTTIKKMFVSQEWVNEKSFVPKIYRITIDTLYDQRRKKL